MRLDISTECRLARAGIQASRSRLDDLTNYLNGLFARCIGRPGFRNGSHSDDVYSGLFSTEDAARRAMVWAGSDLSEMRITTFQNGAMLTGIMGRVA